jgi:hypothetical protein
MDQWWKQNEGLEMGKYSKEYIEDFTGCIPLLLDQCVVDGEIDLGVDEVARIWNQASEFVCRIFDETIKNPRRWKEYVYLAFETRRWL